MSTNVFLNLPVPTSNSAGAAVDTSTLAASKTIIVGGAFAATVTIEYSTAPSGNLWAPVPGGSFQGAGRVTIPLAVKRMRAVTSNYVSGAPNADVGAPFAVAGFVQLTGVAADISALPAFKTVTVSGACIVEVSEDGVSYSQVFAFGQAGAQSAVVTGQFARVTGGVTCWMGGADMGVDPGVSGVAILTWGADVLPDTEGDGDTFLAPGRTASAAVNDVLQLPIPIAGTLRRLFVRHNLDSGDSNNVVYTVLVNGVPTALTVTLAANNVLTSGDTVNEAAVEVGDSVSIRAHRAVETASITLNVVATLVI